MVLFISFPAGEDLMGLPLVISRHSSDVGAVFASN